ncbi:MAG: sigma-70 family RNA polymerase sigma factor [Silicimonas sp.]|nr:sigma-70 family RNA polymerase sigma factor [Silicimonas sp.]
MQSRAEVEHLIAKTALGDKSAFSVLYDATSAKLFGVCLHILKDRTEAEDALQDVYLRIWNKADSYAITGHSPMTWLITVARNLAIDRLRARKETAGDLDTASELPDARPGPEAAAIASSELRRFEDCLNELKSEHASAVKGAYLNGDTYLDLSERYSVPLNTMRTWLRRSLLKLKDCLSR